MMKKRADKKIKKHKISRKLKEMTISFIIILIIFIIHMIMMILFDNIEIAITSSITFILFIIFLGYRLKKKKRLKINDEEWKKYSKSIKGMIIGSVIGAILMPITAYSLFIIFKEIYISIVYAELILCMIIGALIGYILRLKNSKQ